MDNNIFVIDDEPLNTTLISAMIETFGLHSHQYNDASEFFNEGKYNDDSVVILDLNMPGMDGVEVIRQLGESNSKASIIIMSGTELPVIMAAEKLAREHKLNIVTSLPKPISVIDLKTAFATKDKAEILSNNTVTPAKKYQPAVSDILKAIVRHELILHYQPQIDLKTNKLIGVEALVRWEHPEHGLIFPDDFIPLAESAGMIGLLSEEVIKMVLHEMGERSDANNEIQFSVNMSASDINSLLLPEWIEDSIKEKNIDISMLVLEITEGAVMEELITSLDILTRLRMKGLGLSIDDFGTGFSSLAQLHRIPFSELKIDKSFVMIMDEDPQAFSIVKTCIILGQELGMITVAEGIESQEIQDLLTAIGCEVGQGYHISRPLSKEALFKWIDERK